MKTSEQEKYEAVIGLEVHAQLSTDSKIFAYSAAVTGEPPNTLTDPVTLGLPGCLPVLNRGVVDYCIKLGLATNCEIQRESVFARKHYHYPDLPKGYQISQYEKPTCLNGSIEISTHAGARTVRINRIHLEEDAGKNIHNENQPISLVDLNRSGVPLVEIVSEPDLRSPEEAGAYMRQIRQTVRYLDICDGNMDEGSLRCDANVSVRVRGAEELGQKVELKNINSFRFVETALAYEIKRQIQLLESGKTPVQETRLWDESQGKTRSMRSKEFAEDYRYLPDPDLPPLVIDDVWIDNVRAKLPELPNDVCHRFKTVYGLDHATCQLLTQERLVALYFDQAVAEHNNPTALANWIITELFGHLNREHLTMSKCPVSPENLASLVKLIDDKIISGKIAKSVFDQMFCHGSSPQLIVEQGHLEQITNEGEISLAIVTVLEENQKQVKQFLSGNEKVFGYLVGQVMKKTDGKANPQLVNELLRSKLQQ